MTDLIGTRLNQYELAEIIRRGGMSTVYKAYQDSLDRFVAVKVLFTNRDPQFAARFKREARAIAALQHHNILPVYDYGEQEGLLFLVLQYIEGGTTLGDMLGKPMAASTALRLTSHVLDALDYAHKRGVIHRDIKPANVLMPSPNWPMLADFGIAKLMNDNQQRLTLANQIIGTAAYMAPEQATGRPIDARTDLYAAGVVLYELVTGRVPFDSDTPMAVLTKHVYEVPPPARTLNPDLPLAVEQVLQKALQKDPSARYQTAAEMAAELGRIAIDLDHDKNRSQITGLYEVGVQAFEQGQWEQAVERLGKLVELDPGYEDANELLDAAREAQERARTEARQQIEMVRLRRQSGIQQQIRSATESSMVSPKADAATGSPVTDATTLSPATPAPKITAPATGSPVTDATTLSPATPAPKITAPATVKLPALDESTPLPTAPPVATRPQEVAARSAAEAPAAASTHPLADVADTHSAAPAVPPATSGRRLPIAWIVAAAVALVLLLALFFILRGGGQPNTSGTATTAAQNTPASAPTAGGAGVGQAATEAPATVAPVTAEAAGPPPRPAGKQVYTDDFADPKKSGMENLVKATDFQRGIHPPGVYHILVLQPNETHVELFARQAYQNFSAQIDLNDNSDDLAGSVSQGMVFRARDHQHYYALLIDPRAGKYSLRRQNGDKLEELIPWTESPLIKLQKDVNKLRVDATDAAFTFYLNDAKLAGFDDKTFAGGMIGFIVANGDADKPHMHFDNLEIWSSDAPSQASSLEPVRKNPKGDLVLIPGGEFILGSNSNTTHDEPPQMFQLPDFYIDRTEVTNALYRACIAADTCTPLLSNDSLSHPDYANQPKFDSFPVINVSWQQASTFCGWAGKRLPTEAEWEKAASWNNATRQKFDWPWGNTFDVKLLNSDESQSGDTTAVGTFPPELNGTVDMAGNVSEWTSSLFRAYPYDEADGREDPKTPGPRTYRGGSWAQTQGKALAIWRQPAPPESAFKELGFRCAATP
jgi:serine/threonine protein kinase/formylglycine-generating enzyme required for sulfatase activity